jgi:hypothetical protein
VPVGPLGQKISVLFSVDFDAIHYGLSERRVFQSIQGLAQTLSAEGAGASAIYPEPTFVQDWCSFPANLTIEGVCEPTLRLCFQRSRSFKLIVRDKQADHQNFFKCFHFMLVQLLWYK